MGYTYIEPDFVKKYALTDEEVNEAIANGILENGFNEIFYGKIDNNPCAIGLTYSDKKMPQRAKALGVRFMIDCGCTDIFKTEHLGSTCMFLTSYFLIWVCIPNRNMNLRSNVTTYLKSNTPVIVMPLTALKNIRFESRDSSGGWNPIIKEKQGNPVKGAVIGGLVAGTTGAVVGAVAASTPKKTTVIRGGNFHSKIYTAKVEVGEKSIIEAEVFDVDTETKKLYDRYRWTYFMNETIGEKKHDALSFIDGNIIIDYLNTIESITDNAVDYKKRQKCVQIVMRETKQQPNIPIYSSTKIFFSKLCDSIMNCSSESIILKNMVSELKPFYKEKIRQENIQQEITELKQKRDQLGLFRSKDKKKITDEICNLEDTIIKDYEYSLLTKEIATLSFLDSVE